MDVLYLIKQETRRRGYSPRTAEVYCSCVGRFMAWVKKDARKVTRKDIQDYADRLIINGASGSTINVYVNALKFLMEEILCKRILLRIKYSKVPKRLPVVLSKAEVKRLIEAIENPKHRLMTELMYSAGLRVSEVANLKAEDIELERNFGWVRKGKGSKDRLFLIAGRIKEKLNLHIKQFCCSPDSWLFTGRKGRNIDIRSLQEIVKNAARKAGIGKNVHCHTLRHSFATHLIEDGYDVMSVQHLLGHADTQTTMAYVHIASPKIINVKSPYDEY